MENRENPVFGRKVFFLNPPLQIESVVVNQLKEEEYEVYIIRDIKDAKPILTLNKDSILFVNVDYQLGLEVWYNFIKSFKYDEKLSSIFIGVLSTKIDLEYREKFLMDLNLPGGLIMLNEEGIPVLDKIRKILEINGAKGRRQYIRLLCNDEQLVKGYITIGDRMFFIDVHDISSVGFACFYEPNFDKYMVKGSLFNECTLELGNSIRKLTLPLPSVVFDKKSLNGKNIAVMLFTNDVPSKTRALIRNFIFSTLEKKANDFMASTEKDMTDYTITVDYHEEEELSALSGDVGELEEL